MSEDIALATDRLSKRFGRLEAVRQLSITVRRGDIHGFLGLNGAGKTTTIRMILGLIRPSEGGIRLFGEAPGPGNLALRRRVGALVEGPAFYPYLTGRQNLELIARLQGGVAPVEIDRMLVRVGLSPRADTRVRAYSQGMRQRLGIAQALLGDPALVILDEPTNGLDPQGIQEIRALIQSLQRERGTTFFLSSHLLYEVELLCHRISILRAGQLVEEGRVDEILAAGSGVVQVRVQPWEQAIAQVDRLGWVRRQEGAPPGLMHLQAPVERHAELNRALVTAGLEVTEFTPRKWTLEEYFLRHGRAEGAA